MKKGSKHRTESIQKISRSMIGHAVLTSTREKMSIKKKGRPFSGVSYNRKGESLTELHKKRISESNKGEMSHRWKGGITKENHKLRNSREYKLWRVAVLERDGKKCIWCGSSENLHADHIKRFADYPELRFAIDNGRTLCRKCHQTTYKV